MVKGLFFDFYGTIAIYNNLEFADKQTLDIIASYIKDKCEYNRDDLEIRWNNIFNNKFDFNDVEKGSIFIHKLKELYSTFDLDIIDDDLSYIAEKCLYEWHNHIGIPANIHKILGELNKKYKLAIISNFDHSSALRDLLNQHNIAKYFDYIAISGEIGFSKPDNTIFNIVLKELDLTSDEVIFIGDSIVDDINGSNNIGMKNVLIDMSNRYDNYKDCKITTLSELIDTNIIENYNLVEVI